MAISEEYIDKIKQSLTGGVSNSNLANIDSGALASLFKTDRKPIDPALLTLIASAEMTRASSVPGATALGGFGSGIVKGAELKLASDLADRKADASQKSDAMTFLTKLATPKKAGVMKTLGTGQALSYMSEADAIKFLKQRGITENIAGFNEFIKLVSTEDMEQYGTPVIFAGKPMEFNIASRDGVPISVVTNQIQGAPNDALYIAKNNKVKLLQKNDDSVSKMTTLFPRLQTAMTILLDPEVQTGFGQSEGFLRLKQGLKYMFGLRDDDLSDQQIIESISNAIAPQMRPVGSGSTSDMEFKAYKSAILSLGNDKKANYLNLYSLKKMTENGIKLNKLEKQLLSSPKNYSYKYIDDKIAEQDIGIFKKIYNDDNKSNRLYIDGEAKFDDNEGKKEIIADYYRDLKKGDVFLNDDGLGNKLFDGIGMYVIKGIDLPVDFFK
jgi:hypothetical protein